MNKLSHLGWLLIIFLFSQVCLLAQRLEIEEIFPATYPDITVEFRAFDNKDKEIRNYSLNELELWENEIKKAIKMIFCPPEGLSKFSLILTIDISFSMSEPSTVPGKTKMDIVKEAARNAIKALPTDSTRWEAAITFFDYSNELIRDFTNSKWWLNKGLDTFLFNPRGGTDYNAAFLYDVNVPPRPGALLIARKAKYKPVVIFLTDGRHDGRSSPPPSRVNVWVDQILDSAQKYDVTIYAITLGFPVPKELNDICSGTPYGKAYESVPSSDELNSLYSTILSTIGTIGKPAPCKLVFTSDCNGGNIKLIYKPTNVTDSANYSVPVSFLPSIEADKTTINILNKPSSSPHKEKITLKAKNNFVDFLAPGAKSPFNNVTVTDWSGKTLPFKLSRDSSVTVEVNIVPFSDSSFHSFQFDLTTSACSGNTFTVNTGWIYPLDVDCGSGKVGEAKTLTQKRIFCNNWNQPLAIYSVRITDGDQNDFKLQGKTTNITVSPLSCLEFDVIFTPSEATSRESKLVFDTDRGRFESRIFGTGSGQPEILSVPNLDFKTLDCKRQSFDTTIYIHSTGALPLDISKFEITGPNASEFSFVPSNPGSVVVQPGDSFAVKIRVNPSNKGTLNANLVITSNAKNIPSLTIPLQAFAADNSFTLNTNSYDFGFVCPNEVVQTRLSIQNSGNVPITLNISGNQNYSANPNQLALNPNESAEIIINFSSSTEGTFNYTLEVTDPYCNAKKTIQLKAIVESPKIQKQPIAIFGIVGLNKDTTIAIRNISNRNLTISSAQFTDPQLSLVSPPLPWTIPANASIQVNIRFSPTTGGNLVAFLKMQGEPCSFDDSLLFQSNPVASRAEIVIEDHKGLIGEIVSIPILIRNGVMLDQSGTTKVRTTLAYDASVLKFVSTQPAVSVIQNLNEITFDNIPFNPAITTLLVVNFEVLESNAGKINLELKNTSSVDGFILFKEIAGTFEIIYSSAEISVGEVTANTGEEFLLPIYLKNAKNITSFHKSISTELTFNFTLIEPIAPTQNVVTDINTFTGKLSLSNLPITPEPDGSIAKLRFRAKLGTQSATEIKISNTKTEKGVVKFNETSGKFEVANICRSGGERLFNPSATLSLKVNPNFDNSTIDIRLRPQEFGQHLIKIYNSIGMELFELAIDVNSFGEMSFSIPFEGQNNVYFIVLKTPSASVFEKLLWIR